MAIDVTSRFSSADAADEDSYVFGTVTPGADDTLLLALVLNTKGSAPDTPTLSGLGVTWEQVATVAASNNDRTTLFRAMGDFTAGNITVDFGGETQTACHLHVVELTDTETSGANGSGAVVQSDTETGSAGNGEACDLASFADPTNNVAIVAGSVNANDSGFDVGGTWTPLSELVGGARRSIIGWKTGEDTTPDLVWSGVTRTYTIIGAEIAIAGVAGATEVNPTPAVAATAVPPPTVDRVLALAPSPVAIPAVVPVPAAELSLSVAPAPAEATVAVPPPTVTFGALAFTADPAEVAAVVPAPALERTLDVTPDPVATTVALMAPTVARTLAATAGPAVAELVVPAPAVSLSLAAAADPVETELVVPPPTVTVQGGALAMLPAPAIAAVVIPPPAVTMGAITLQPDPVALAIAAGQPAAELAMRTEAGPVVTVLAVPAPAVTFGVGQITIEPQPIVLTLVAPAPRVTSARVRITKEALVDRAWAAAQTRRPARISGRTAGV